VSRESAKIFQFPASGRFAASGNLDEDTPVANLTSPRLAETVLGSAWYHDEAVQAEELVRN
jgi:hypothetical protein